MRELDILSLECVGANGLTIIHTGTGSGGPGWAKGGDGAAYVMPDWTGRMASYINNTTTMARTSISCLINRLVHKN